MDNQTRRILLERVRASGFPGSIMDVFQNPTILDQHIAEQQQQQEPIVAQTPQEQGQGLRPYHERGQVNQSMAFPNVQPGQSFNTVGMKIPIDINKYNNQGHLVESYKAVPPGISNLPTGPNEGMVIESPAKMQKGGFSVNSDVTTVNLPTLNKPVVPLDLSKLSKEELNAIRKDQLEFSKGRRFTTRVLGFTPAEEDSKLENFAEYLDPTGLLSWDDVEAARDSKTMPSGEKYVNYAGAVPVFGKAPKIVKGISKGVNAVGLYLDNKKQMGGTRKYQTAGVRELLNKLSNPENANALANESYRRNLNSYETRQKALEAEKARVSKVRSNVIPESAKLDKADNPRQPREGSLLDEIPEWDAYVSSSNPKELEENRKKLPKNVLDILPNQGKYTVSRWDKEEQNWEFGASPSRELYCTPYGCFAYQKAGATDVPIVSGNVGFASQSEKGQLPFEKINPSDREPGDMALLVETAPSSYIGAGRNTLVRRPHHTTIYNKPTPGEETNTETGQFYNALDGRRGNFGLTTYYTNYEKDDRIDYYRYVGATKAKEAELKKAEEDLAASREFQKNARSLIKPISSIDKRLDLKDIAPVLNSRSQLYSENTPKQTRKRYFTGGLNNRVLYNKAKYKR
jgi:hypothetical protein